MISKITTNIFLLFITFFYGYMIYTFIVALTGYIPTDKFLLPPIYQWLL